jgi:hypothetical protein
MTSARRLLLACAFGLVACGDDASSDDHDAASTIDGGATQHDAASAIDSASNTDDVVSCDASYPSFSAGMSVKAGTLTAKLLSIDPQPPRQLVNNKWLVQIVDANGAPVSDIALANGDTYMPVHRHHGKGAPTFVAGSDPGTVQLNGVNFIMRGPWQVIFDVQRAGATVGTAVFQICVE